MMIQELLFNPEVQEYPDGPAINLLVVLSALRDDMPWLYDLGMEIYRALRTQDPEQVKFARRNFMTAMEVIERSKFMRHMFMEDDKESYMIFRELPRMIIHYLERFESPRTRKGRKEEEIEKDK